MIGLGETFPLFDLEALYGPHDAMEVVQVSNDNQDDMWRIYVFWPRDFTPVCATELTQFAMLSNDFLERDALIIGGSTDSTFVHAAWRKETPMLINLPFPMMADTGLELTTSLGIVESRRGAARRATYIVDPNNIIRFVLITDFSVGRNPHEVLRVLDALQTDDLCPCNWHRGEPTISKPTVVKPQFSSRRENAPSGLRHEATGDAI